MSIHYFDEPADADIDVTIKSTLCDVGTHFGLIYTRIGFILSDDTVHEIQIA